MSGIATSAARQKFGHSCGTRQSCGSSFGGSGRSPGKQSSFRLGEADREAALEVRQDFWRAELVPLAISSTRVGGTSKAAGAALGVRGEAPGNNLVSASAKPTAKRRWKSGRTSGGRN